MVTWEHARQIVECCPTGQPTLGHSWSPLGAQPQGGEEVPERRLGAVRGQVTATDHPRHRDLRDVEDGGDLLVGDGVGCRMAGRYGVVPAGWNALWSGCCPPVHNPPS